MCAGRQMGSTNGGYLLQIALLWRDVGARVGGSRLERIGGVLGGGFVVGRELGEIGRAHV